MVKRVNEGLYHQINEIKIDIKEIKQKLEQLSKKGADIGQPKIDEYKQAKS